MKQAISSIDIQMNSIYEIIAGSEIIKAVTFMQNKNKCHIV